MAGAAVGLLHIWMAVLNRHLAWGEGSEIRSWEGWVWHRSGWYGGDVLRGRWMIVKVRVGVGVGELANTLVDGL